MAEQSTREALRRRFMQPISMGLLGTGLVGGVLSWLAEPGNVGAYGLWGGALVCLASLAAIRRARSRLAVLLVTHFFLALPTAIFVARPEVTGPGMTALAATLMVALSAFLLGSRAARNLAMLAIGCVLLVGWRLRDPAQWQSSSALVQTFAAISLLALSVTVLLLFVRHERELRHAVERHAADMERVVEGARAVARGELRGLDEQGDIMSDMVGSLRTMVEDVRAIVVDVGGASRQLAHASRAHSSGAASQAAAVSQIGETLVSLSEAARVVADSSVEAVDAAERGLGHHVDIAEKMGDLGEKTERITEVVGLIRDIATKVEILALNAALEGARAGTAGAGFSIVADQLRVLADEVVQSLDDVRRITGAISAAASETTARATAGRQMAERMASVADLMHTMSEQQAEGVRGVAGATDDIAKVAQDIARTSQETLHASAELGELAERLDAAVRRFKT